MNNLEDTTGWDYLPDIALSNIFKRLEEKDRFNASLVCKLWSRAFKFPELWRKMKFGERSILGGKASGFASSLAECLHELEIDCIGIGDSRNKSKFRNFIKFLSILTEKPMINLEKFVFTNFNSIEVESHDDERRTNAEILIYKFLGKQSNLAHLDMEECAASLKIGLQFLDQLAKNSAQSMKILHLKHFFAQDCEALLIPNYREIVCSFKGLVELYINFNCIDSNILTKIAENCCNTLEVLKICCNDDYRKKHIIPNSTWASVKKMCPKLEVDVDIESLCYVGVSYSEVIPSEMGLRSFKGVMNEDEDGSNVVDDGELDALLNQLGQFPDTLTHVFLEFDSEIDFDEELLIQLVSTCPGLKTLHFSGSIEFQIFKEVCEMQKDGEINLEKCKFDILYKEGDNVTPAYINLIERLIQSIREEQGAHFVLDYDEIPMFFDDSSDCSFSDEESSFDEEEEEWSDLEEEEEFE